MSCRLNWPKTHLTLLFNAISFYLMITAFGFLSDQYFVTYRLEKVNLKCNSGKAKLMGTVVCIGGAALLTLYKGVPLFHYSKATTQRADHATKLIIAKKTQRWTVGSVALVIGTSLWSSWFLLQSSIGKRYPCKYSSTAIMSFFGSIQSAILSLLIHRNLSLWVLKGKIQIITVVFAVSKTFLSSFLHREVETKNK